jgi:hypothetical protein
MKMLESSEMIWPPSKQPQTEQWAMQQNRQHVRRQHGTRYSDDLLPTTYSDHARSRWRAAMETATKSTESPG